MIASIAKKNMALARNEMCPAHYPFPGSDGGTELLSVKAVDASWLLAVYENGKPVQFQTISISQMIICEPGGTGVYDNGSTMATAPMLAVSVLPQK